MLNKAKDKEFLLDIMDLFYPLQIEDSPNYPIVNPDDSRNENLVCQIKTEIKQQVARLSDSSIILFENDSQLAGLITSSGGHKKSLYWLIYNTASYTETLPVQQRAIDKARGVLKYTLSNSIEEYQWSFLTKIYRAPFFAYTQVEQYAPLPKWSVLEYEYKGSGMYYYRVHPLLVETQQFRRAIENFR